MKAAFRRLVARLLEYQVRRLIRRHHPRVIAVAGSVGKTSTKMFVAAVISQKYRTLVQEGNYNTEIGLPLSFFNLRVPTSLLNPLAWGWLLVHTERLVRDYSYEAVVIELGTDHPGEIPGYLRYLRPDLGIMTAITPEHMENFPGGLDEVAAEELQLAAHSKTFLAGHDDIAAPHRRKYIEPHPDHHYYGLGAKVEYGLTVTSTDPVNGTVLTLLKQGKPFAGELKLGLYGAHSAKAAAAAAAAGDLLGLTPAEISAGLATVHPVPGRMNPLPGLNGSIIIDDTYNSSPAAIVAAMEALAATPVAGRRIAVMGSMNELGSESPRYHQEAGPACAGVDLLVTVGELANKHLGPAAVRAGLDPTRWKPADSPYAAGAYLASLLSSGDVVLAKGSQNRVFVEETVKVILADPADARKLVRGSHAWQLIKASQFPDAPRE